MTVRGGENIGAKREKVSEFVEFPETSKSARIRTNPRKHATIDTKKPTGEGLVFGDGERIRCYYQNSRRCAKIFY
jgi:hypothetical protein